VRGGQVRAAAAGLQTSRLAASSRRRACRGYHLWFRFERADTRHFIKPITRHGLDAREEPPPPLMLSPCCPQRSLPSPMHPLDLLLRHTQVA
jgi:hypothetical protein